MTAPDPSRRRFLRGLVAALGAAGLGSYGLSRLADGGDAPAAAQLEAIEPLPALDPPTTAAPATTTSTTTSSTTTTTETPSRAITIAAICGEAWGALPVAGEFRTHTIERLTVHHTASLLERNSQAPARARQHQTYHIDRGWPDLAYHYLVDANGHVYKGRPVEAVGDTGTEYDPTGHFLVCAEGHFDEQEIGQPQIDMIVNVLAWAAGEFDVSPTTIRGHRDWASTTCPGDNFYPIIANDELAGAVQARLDAGGATMSLLCGDDAQQLVADIEAGRI